MIAPSRSATQIAPSSVSPGTRRQPCVERRRPAVEDRLRHRPVYASCHRDLDARCPRRRRRHDAPAHHAADRLGSCAHVGARARMRAARHCQTSTARPQRDAVGPPITSRSRQSVARVAGRRRDRHLVVPHVEARERTGERDAAVAEDPHRPAGSSTKRSLTWISWRPIGTTPSALSCTGTSSPGSHAVGSPFGSSGVEVEQRTVQLGDRARRVHGPPRGIRVAVDDELQQDAHAPVSHRRRSAAGRSPGGTMAA